MEILTLLLLIFKWGGDFSYNYANNDFVWNASDSLVVLGSAFVTANGFINNGSITADTFSLSVAGDFDYTSDFLDNGNIYANNQYFTIRNGDFTNNTSIALAGNLGITANNFINTGGSITADAFALSVAGDLDYAGNIEATSLNFQVGGDFSYSDANNNFVWNANNSLVVLGSASVTANDFSNKGRIDVANNFDVSAGDDFFNRGIIDVANNFDVLAGDDFYNWYGAIINANNFNVLTGDRFYNLHSATINTDSLNVSTGGLFANRYNATSILPLLEKSFAVTKAFPKTTRLSSIFQTKSLLASL